MCSRSPYNTRHGHVHEFISLARGQVLHTRAIRTKSPSEKGGNSPRLARSRLFARPPSLGHKTLRRRSSYASTIRAVSRSTCAGVSGPTSPPSLTSSNKATNPVRGSRILGLHDVLSTHYTAGTILIHSSNGLPRSANVTCSARSTWRITRSTVPFVHAESTTEK